MNLGCLGPEEIPLLMNLGRLGPEEIPLTPTPLPKGEGNQHAPDSDGLRGSMRYQCESVVVIPFAHYFCLPKPS